LKELRKQHVAADTGAVPKSVLWLQKLLAKTKLAQKRGMLYTLLAQEYARAGREREEIETMRASAREFKEEPVPWVALASRLSFDQSSRAEARKLAEHALELATTSDRFVRYALGTRARIGVQLADYRLVEDSIRRLVADSRATREEDVGPEFDFVESLPDGAVDPQLIERYRSLYRGR
jgi:hypothetical protein